LRWFDNRPLFGKRIVVTRAYHQSKVLSDLLIQRGALPIELPTIEIKPLADTRELDSAISNLCHYQWILFTSVNGVNSFFRHLYTRNRDARALNNLKFGAIGPATAEALKTKGISPDYVPKTYTSRGVVTGLKKLNIVSERFLIPRADIADEELARGIRKLGAGVDIVAAYQTTHVKNTNPLVKRMLLKGAIDAITFTSSSTVVNFIELFPDRKLFHSVKIACIGPRTARTAAKAGMEVDIVAQEHTILGLVAAMEQHFAKET
jgi:uroporphyrinogen III methyltransferase/synthase